MPMRLNVVRNILRILRLSLEKLKNSANNTMMMMSKTASSVIKLLRFVRRLSKSVKVAVEFAQNNVKNRKMPVKHVSTALIL